MLRRLRTVSVCLVLAVGSASAHGGVKMAQDVTLQVGWNALYLSVMPDESADAIFGSWPVGSVGKYNPASFLETKQFSGSGTTEGALKSAFALWKRGEPSLSQFDRVVANNIYVCYATNDWKGTLYGRPMAPRTTWHPTATNTPRNYIGISIVPGTTTTLDAYLDGLDVGNTTFQKVYRPYGANPDVLSLGPLTASDPLTDGSVVVMSASKASDWSGVLKVSPMEGVDFSTNLTRVSLMIRNDSSTNRTMRLMMTEGNAQSGEAKMIVPTGLKLRDTSVQTNAWCDFSRDRPFDRPLAPKEELTLQLALDRTQLPKGLFGGLLHVLDLDGGSNFRATIPVEAEGLGGDARVGAWPMGVWLASGRFDKVTSYDRTASGQDVASGGQMEVRLPMYVDEKGDVALLSRFVFGTDTNGVTHVYSGKVEENFPVPIGNVRRVSSAVLPIDGTNATITTTNALFGTKAVFEFTVGEHSRVNPMRHAYHPSHDSLRWDFTTPTPSGDDPLNYVSTVKPETFSVANRIVFEWDAHTGTSWNPEEQLSGTLLWELGGVRREGPVRMSGTFVMKRIANVVIDR